MSGNAGSVANRRGSPAGIVSILSAALSAALVFSCAGESMRTEIVAHRGASWTAPENTLAAVRLAWREGADAVEVDVYRTRDGKIVTLHDKDTKRVTGVEGLVAEQTLEELRRLDAGGWKDPRYKGERVPTLSEVLAEVPAGKRLFIEIKCGPEILPELVRVLEAAGKEPGQIVLIGFGLETVTEAKRKLPRLKVYWLSGWKKDKETGRWVTRVEDLIRQAREARVDGLDLAADGPLDEEAVRRIREAGLELHVWTVNDPDVARRMEALGVDSITTDRPAWIRERLLEAPGDRGEAAEAAGGS